ncbi:MAG: GGDEF domain-containing protein [Clostridia bacterium]|nr:GGDEF domain-containing protein [Clostridia bacterium]MDE7400956.1 GGDEF domain-containing protein [Clostridia bacterium]
MGKEYSLSHFEYFKDRDLSHSLDTLTGILNREALMGYVNWLIENNRKFSFFLVDVDNFKNVNDTYGHLVGDIVISQMAAYFVKMSGKQGVVARYGGDEFIILCEDVSEYNDVWKIGHEINMRIGGIVFEGIPNLAITVSMGIARFPLDANTPQKLMETADKALYRAKMKGRNCFIIYLPEKHANISLKKERDKQQTQMQLTYTLFGNLTACGEDISLAINTVFKSFISYYMFDHICLETPKNINHSIVFTLSSQKQFKHIPIEMIDSLINSAGYISLNNVEGLNEDSYGDIMKEYAKQQIKSTLYCKISSYGVDYGYIRVDTSNTARIWQNTEIAMVMTAANVIGLLLHYQKKTLEDLPLVVPTEAGSIE